MRVARVDIDAVIPTRSKLRGALGPERFLLLWRMRSITERKRRSDVREFVAPEFTMRVQAFALASLAAVTDAMAAAYGQVAGQSAPSPPAQMTIAGCLKASPNPSGVPDTTTYTLEPIEAVAPTAPGSSLGAPAGRLRLARQRARLLLSTPLHRARPYRSNHTWVTRWRSVGT